MPLFRILVIVLSASVHDATGLSHPGLRHLWHIYVFYEFMRIQIIAVCCPLLSHVWSLRGQQTTICFGSRQHSWWVSWDTLGSFYQNKQQLIGDSIDLNWTIIEKIVYFWENLINFVTEFASQSIVYCVKISGSLKAVSSEFGQFHCKVETSQNLPLIQAAIVTVYCTRTWTTIIGHHCVHCWRLDTVTQHILKQSCDTKPQSYNHFQKAYSNPHLLEATELPLKWVGLLAFKLCKWK